MYPSLGGFILFLVGKDEERRTCDYPDATGNEADQRKLLCAVAILPELRTTSCVGLRK